VVPGKRWRPDTGCPDRATIKECKTVKHVMSGSAAGLLSAIALLSLGTAAPASCQPEGSSVELEAKVPFIFPHQALQLTLTLAHDGGADLPAVPRDSLVGSKTLVCAKPAPPGEERKGVWASFEGKARRGRIGPLQPGERFIMTARVRLPEELTASPGVINLQWVGTRGPLKGLRSNELQISVREGTTPICTLDTSEGAIVFEMLPDLAPNHVANLIELAQKGFYDGILFHRVAPNFMVQCGCPEGTGQGGPGYSIAAEFGDTEFKKGVVGMARTSEPDSAGSQFFICVADSPHLNGKYTAFGRVIHGQNVADAISRKPCRPGSERPTEDVVIRSVHIDLPPGYDNPGVNKIANKD
jgi:peptidyl-prolyl cis-trans isomerase B (cyclophilin B)